MRLEGEELKRRVEEQEKFIKEMKFEADHGEDNGTFAIAEAIGRLTLLMLLDR